jgi:AcrR family transcriptional regulator
MTDTILVQRARGRPRDSGKDAAIREAAWRILAERGFDGLTFEGVAELASCSRATLYRRYASKVELVSSVLYETSRSIEPTVPAEALPRDILIAHATAAALYMSDYRGQALLNLTTATFRLPELASATESHGENEREFYMRELRRIGPGASEDALAFAYDTLIGGIIYHVAFRRRSLAPDEIARLVDGAIALLAD